MRYIVWTLGVLSVTFWSVPTEAIASAYSIPPEKVDAQKVYYGNSAGFDKPGNVDYALVIRSTPEYTEVKKKKIESGTGRYWILLSQASDRAVRAISEVGQEKGYDLIAAQGYLGSLEPPIPAEDITQLVLTKITGKSESGKDSAKEPEKASAKDAGKDAGTDSGKRTGRKR